MKRLALLLIGMLATACATTAPDSDPNTTPTAAPATADLDERVNTEYERALNAPGADREALEASQIEWQTQREACAEEDDPARCERESSMTRLVELQIADPATAAPIDARYTCPDDKELTAQYYNDIDPQAGVFTWDGEQMILFIEMSGSGARYGRDGVSFWEHQGEATFDYHGDTVVCEVA
ncbi:MliC family protein [Hoyosella sp. YIM 151337]|uniref:MliC family protein n=1 Tax=Hoyosella sp. YIM 151337 TaxID=2992742 RepID=UPI002236001E|nr:MliC family protein [Hoyosella sp. YIM 151337]MCW4352895.1 MliC family protein [Hoyosella sp. YIM 151337]